MADIGKAEVSRPYVRVVHATMARRKGQNKKKKKYIKKKKKITAYN